MNTASTTDKEICDLLRAHEQKGLKLLFDTRYKPLVSWANMFVNHLAAAEDLVQELFIDLWNGTIREELRPGTLDSFLRVLVRNRAYNQMKKRDALTNHEDIEKVDAIFQEYDDSKDKIIAEVFKEVELLPAQTRQVLDGVFVDGLKYREVAERLGVSVSTVKTLLGNAIHKLRERLDSNRMAQFLLIMTSTLPHLRSHV